MFINGALYAAAIPIVFDLIQDLGVDFGEDAVPVPGYGPEQGVGTKYQVAAFAGGCFWCMEAPFDKLGDGVIATLSGYTGGATENPTYREVSAGTTGHAETVQVVYDPTLVSYEQLLDAYWHSIDPTTLDRQFVDSGTQYRTAIYYYNEEQKRLAETSRDDLAAANTFRAPIVTEITEASTFYPAEKYHQDYYKKKAMKYSFYRSLSEHQLGLNYL
ncbi:hypothetical protein CYMTET_10325 [Cymbomonas tetramitiformis]|uniref:peptide-methionine (S)-S-oxide reductase n=1 Tax=Cymbomonas tetramitiformis TaxID=36881 RepID=A0AAE0GPV0_9CHLO|nr:hypothetical protein CYMTET_10325 [Cymbomonas tetramitiformis]